MSLKLGELLLREKIVTSQQLEEALKNHVLYGIKLGSSLVEMGYMEEGQLAQLLSDKLAVPRAGRKEIKSASKEAIDKLSSKQAAKYRAIPFSLDRNRLSVAMSDPSDLRAIEELGFITGCIIIPFIAPDLVISKALAKIYQLSAAEARYRMLPRSKDLDTTRPIPQTVTFPMTSPSGEPLNITVPAEFSGFANYTVPVDYHESTSPIEAVPRGDAADEQPVSFYSIEQLSKDFARSRSRDTIADALIRYLGQEFDTGAIFLVHGDVTWGWRGISKRVRLKEFEQLNLPLNRPSVLQIVVHSKDCTLGVLEDNAIDRKIFTLLKLELHSHLLIVPVIIHNAVVALVAVSTEDGAFHRRIGELEKLVYKMSLAFEKLIIEEKILMT